MEIKNGRRQTFPIEYVEVTEENIAEAAIWGGGVVGDEDGVPFVKILDKNAINTRQTKAYVGDYIVHHLELKTFKSFSKKAFAKAFEETREGVLRRDAATGEIVTEAFANKNQSTTTTEHVTVGIPVGEDPNETVTLRQKGTDRTATVPAEEADGIDPKLLGAENLNPGLPRDADPS